MRCVDDLLPTGSLYQRLNVLPSKFPIISCRSDKTAYQHMTYLNWAQCSRVKNILISLYRHESVLWLMRRPPFPVPFMLLLVASYQIGKISSLVIVIAIAENIWFIYSASQGVTEKDVCNAIMNTQTCTRTKGDAISGWTEKRGEVGWTSVPFPNFMQN